MAFRSLTALAQSTSTTAQTITKPAGVVDGDILTILCIYDNGGATTTWPSGFSTEVSHTFNTGSRQKIIRYVYRVASSEPASYDVTSSASTNRVFVMLAHSGRDTTTPLSVTPVFTTNIGASASPVSVALNGVTALAGDDLVSVPATDPSVGSSISSGSWTPPGTFTARHTTDGTWLDAQFQTSDNVTAGATGAITSSVTLSSGTSNYCGLVIALKAASSTTIPVFNATSSAASSSGLSARG